MKTGTAGLNLIKSFEGCRLAAYKCVSTEKYYTIGYGHYGADVKLGMTITQAQADAYLVSDLTKFEGHVNATGLSLNQNQFDALVSFTYNCGQGNLKTLIANRTIAQIAEALLKYNKSGGKVLAGLTRRRTAERKLFLAGTSTLCAASVSTYYDKYAGNGTLLVALMESGCADNTLTHRKKIAVANGIAKSEAAYTGSESQNLSMLKLLKQGKLIKA